jgi:hypothetical protein
MSRETYGDDGLRLDPQKLRNFDTRKVVERDWWYYESQHGLEIFHQQKSGHVTQSLIPRRQVLAYARAIEGKRR